MAQPQMVAAATAQNFVFLLHFLRLYASASFLQIVGCATLVSAVITAFLHEWD